MSVLKYIFFKEIRNGDYKTASNKNNWTDLKVYYFKVKYDFVNNIRDKIKTKRLLTFFKKLILLTSAVYGNPALNVVPDE